MPGERNMSPIFKLHNSTLFRHASVLLTLLLCIVFVLPLPMADSAAAGSCSVNTATSSSSLVSAQNPKDQSVPFPCQNRPCGCRSADSCLKKCCCFTAAQKVAWAKSTIGSQTPKMLPHATTAAANAPKPNTRWRTVSFISSLECQGLGIAGVCFLVSLTTPDSPQLPNAAATDYPRPASDSLPTASLQPPQPPPKLFV